MPPSNAKLKELPGAILGRSLKVATFGHTYINKHLLLYAELTGGMKKKKKYPQGSFKNYVDKTRCVGGQKMPVFVHVQGKNVHVEIGTYSKKGKICPRSY